MYWVVSYFCQAVHLLQNLCSRTATFWLKRLLNDNISSSQLLGVNCLQTIILGEPSSNHTSVVVRSIKKRCEALPRIVYSVWSSAVDRNSKCINLKIGAGLLASMETIKHRALTKIGNTERETGLMGKMSVELSVHNREQRLEES